MLGTIFSDIAAKNGLTTASGMAYGMLGGCFVTLSEATDVLRISIYVGPQEQPMPGYCESRTVSCARQLCHAISTASGPDNIYSLMMENETVPALVLNHAGSVVTVNFPDEPESRTGVERFVSEVLPQAAALTRPTACICCGSESAGAACPVRLSADTVVPMHEACYKKVAESHKLPKAERVQQVKATVAAALGALLGAVVWAFLAKYGPIAWAVGLLMGLLPAFLYDLFKGRPGRTRIVTVGLCAAIAAVLGSLGAGLIFLRAAYEKNITAYSMNMFGAISFRAYLPEAIANNKALNGFIFKTLAAGLAAAGIGCLALLFRKADKTDSVSPAAKPRRLKGKL